MAINRDEDGRFQEMARALAVQDRPRKTRIADSIDEGFDSLDPDPYLFSRDDDDDYNGDSRMYVRDYSRPSAGTASQAPSFWLPLHDLGDGRVDIRAAAGWLNGQEGTFTRATAATCRMKNGLLKKVLSGVPRSHYLASGAYGGYLAEGARTNLCLQSEDFANTWTPIQSSVVANAVAAPDGTTTADFLKDDATAAAIHFVSQQFAKAGSALAYTASVFVKAGSRTRGELRSSDLAGNGFKTTFDLSAGTVSAAETYGAGTTATGQAIESWGNGWYRVSVSGTSNTATDLDIEIFLADASGNVTYNGDNASGFYVWGAQLEAATFASSYIPTTTASATRNADVLTFLSTGAIGRHEGTIIFEASRLAVSDAATILLQLDNGTSDERVLVQKPTTTAGSVRWLSFTGAVATGIVDLAQSANQTIKCAARYALNDNQFAYNGVLGAADTAVTVPVGLAHVRVGGNSAGGETAFACIKGIEIFQRGLPDAQLTARAT